jgi:DNA-binding CsgD family transcriptional regulator
MAGAFRGAAWSAGRDAPRRAGSRDDDALRTLDAMLGGLESPAFAIDDAMRLVWCNAAARALLATREWVVAVGGALQPVADDDAPDWTRMLCAALTEGFATGELRGARGDVAVRVVRVAQRWRVVLLDGPVDGGRSRGAGSADVPGATALTASEREVLAGLLHGRSPAEIARERSTSLLTVRAQIRSILGKTGARSIRTLIVEVLRARSATAVGAR